MVSLLAESWTWFSLVVFVTLSRFISRRMALGAFKRLQADDYGMAITIAFYTTFIVAINIVANTNSNLLPPGFDVNSLTTQEIQDRSYGSKLILVVEQCQCVTIWGTKCCLLALYLRLTTLRKENIAIKLLLAYVSLSFVVMEILYFAVWCRPFWEYWAVPTNSVQCDAATNHLITNAVFNLTSDCAMLAIGLPMFLGLRLPWQKKVPLVLIFSLGIFVILAAVLNKVYSFSEPFGSAWTYWYVRESSTAMLVANLPFVWTCWRWVFGASTMSGGSHQIVSQNNASLIETQGEPKSSSQSLGSDHSPGNARVGKSISDEYGLRPSNDSSGMTLHELLHNDATSAEYPADATQITHPWLFSRKGKDNLLPLTEKAVIRDHSTTHTRALETTVLKPR